MAEEKPPTHEEKLARLIRWDATDARAIAEQLLERVIEAQKRGATVGLVGCFIESREDGSRRLYEVCASTLPVEVIFWAAKQIAMEVEKR